MKSVEFSSAFWSTEERNVKKLAFRSKKWETNVKHGKKPKGQMDVKQNNTKTYEISRVETFASNLAQLLLASVSVRFGSIV